MKRNAFALGGACALVSFGAAAQQSPAPASPTQLDPVVISAERSRQTTFDAPAAISAVTRETIESAGPQVNLSEVLNRVPGISVLNRQNFSQDLQLSIRGFGSRSTFGIRGVRLIVDGIPATMPDGQGQASNIALTSAGRIEVLRGPLAQLYGNAAGGVVQVFTDMDSAQVPTTTVSGSVGAYGQSKVGMKFGGAGPNDAVVLDASAYHTDGFRPHSKAHRDQINGKWQHDVSPDTRFSLIVNSLDQPVALDPLGLTRAQWEQGLQANVGQDPRKTVLQQQIGSVFEQRLGEATQLTARVYFGQRDLDNALSIPLAVQAPSTHSGGIVVFSRSYQGLGVQLSHALKFDSGQALRLVGGIDVDSSDEDRQGYLNNAGVRGALKRDERNRADNRDVFAQASFDIDSQWTATAGVRSSHVRFRSNDRFITLATVPPNPDDSGSISYSATNPVLGVSWRAAPALNVYANVGQGFETPTFTELSYRPAPLTGLNTDLKASKSRHAEVGAKWKVTEGQRIDAALFDIATRDEIVVDTNVGGRSTFKNAGKTSRRGIEFSHIGQWDESLRSTLSLTLMRARFNEDFISGTGATPNVFSGYHLPGTPERNLFAELAWAPRGAWGGFSAGVEVVRTDKLYVNDLNTDAAPAATVLNLRAGFEQKLGEWQFSQLLRVDNAASRNYAGSVIVNEANSRFFEPAPPRNWLVALKARYEFR